MPKKKRHNLTKMPTGGAGAGAAAASGSAGAGVGMGVAEGMMLGTRAASPIGFLSRLPTSLSSMTGVSGIW